MTVPDEAGSSLAGDRVRAGSGSPDVSFVIPARNESDEIGRTLRDIEVCVGGRVRFEIVVVDHGSDDETAAVARAAGARVVTGTAPTIGGIRNEGVDEARGDVLVFLDADVSVTAQWGERIRTVVEEIRSSPGVVTGSLCSVPGNASWIEHLWFESRREVPTHLGSGHMLVDRKFFESLGGFDASLETGEDYDFCSRVRQEGGTIRLDSRLRAIHRGYPVTLRSFVEREIWHGKGDFQSVERVLRSKVAMAAISFFLLHLVILAGIGAGSVPATVAGIGGVGALVVAVAVRKFGLRRSFSRVLLFPLTYAYLLGRVLSLLTVLRRAISGRGSTEA